MDWACVAVAASVNVPVSSSVPRIPVVEMIFTICRSLGPAIGLTAGSTEIGAETREELSIEETAKTDIMPTNHHA